MAGKLGFADEGPGTLPELTPLLAAGEGGHQRFTRILRGPLGGTARTAGPCVLAAFVYQFRRSRDHGWDRSNTGEIPCVLVAVELELPGQPFRGVYVQEKEPFFGYSGTRHPFEVRALKTGDAELHGRYDVWVHDLQDEATARRLLEDGLSDFLAAYPVAPGFEVSGAGSSSVRATGPDEVSGTWLCTFVERCLTTEAEVLDLLDAARGLVPRIIAAGHSSAVGG